MKVLCFGSLNIDYTYQVDHFVKKGETLSSDGLAVYTGGKGLNQSLALARAGADVTLAGAIGKDGLFLLDTLKEGGVDTSCVKVLEEERTGNAIIQNDREGDNCILLYGGANQKITREMADEVLGRFSAGDFLLLQNEINELPYIMERAHAAGMHIVLNPSPMNAKILSLPLSCVDYFLLNEGEAAGILGVGAADCGYEELLQGLKKQFPEARVVMTVGGDGSFYADKVSVRHQEAYRVKAQDTTAAGDTYTGYFIASLLAQKTPEEAMERASKASAICVTRKGAAPSIPTPEEVESWVFG
ncbi:MAG: ribokinase [Clostridium sp.]|nr:ribokinase [Clostridium sp.]